MDNISVEDKVNKLVQFLRGKRLVPFVGSGISLFPPSELPTGGQLRDGILEALAKRSPERLKTHINAAKGKEPNPELVYQIIYDNVGDYFFSSYNLLEIDKANSNHLFLARLAKHGYLRTIVTTNFDCLIEHAFKKEKVDFYVYYDERGFSMYLSQDNRGRIAIIKLHGTIEDRQSMIATLRQVGKGLSPNQAQILDNLLKEQHVLFIGYSGNDFDLYPKLLSMADTAKGIHWNFGPQERPSQQMQRLLTTYGDKANHSFMDLAELLEKVANELKIPYDKRSHTSETEKSQRKQRLQFLNRWASKIDEYHFPSIIGHLSNRLGDYEAAICSWIELLGIAEKNDLYFDRAVAYLNLGLACRNKSQWDEAVKYLQRSLEVLESLAILEGAESIKVSVSIDEEIEKVYSALGLVYTSKHQWDEAIEYHQKSLEISEKLPDTRQMEVMARSYNNLGVVYQGKRQWDEAASYHKKSLGIFEKLGDIQNMASIYNNFGLVYQGKRQWDEAVSYYQKGLEIFEKLGDMQNSASTYNNLGAACHKKLQFDEAVQYYKKSLEIFEKLGDMGAIAEIYNNLGALYKSKGQLDEAVECYNESLQIFAELRDTQSWVRTYNNLLRIAL